MYQTVSYINLTKHLLDIEKVSERLRSDWVQAIFAWPLVKHLQSRRYLSDPFLLQRDDPSVGDTPAIQTLIADWWLSEIHQKIPFLWWIERKKQILLLWVENVLNYISLHYFIVFYLFFGTFLLPLSTLRSYSLHDISMNYVNSFCNIIHILTLLHSKSALSTGGNMVIISYFH